MIIAEEVLRCFEGDEEDSYSSNSEFLEVTVPVRDGVTLEMEGVMIISVPTNEFRTGRAELGSTVFVLQVVLTLIVLAAALLCCPSAGKPFGKVTASLEEMRGTFMEEDISIPDYTETELLSEAYNRML